MVEAFLDQQVRLIAAPGLRAPNTEKGTDVANASAVTVPLPALLSGAAPNAHRTAEGLLAAVGNGDRTAFDELYSMFGGRVLGLAVKVVIDREQAKEVAQDVFLQLWQQACRFDPARGSASSWILRVTHARAVDRVRMSHNRTARDTRYANGHHVPDTDTVVDSVLISADRSAVRLALLALTPLQRESVLLAYFGGLSTAEIAGRIGVLRSTVKTRIRDGLLRLAAEMAAESSSDVRGAVSTRGRNRPSISC